MNNLFIINEYQINGYTSYTLDIISVLAILCGIAVIISKNPIISILYLIGLFASVSVYLIIIGLSFIGLSYLIVYIGAVSMLFLFILMLINIRVSELQSETSNSLFLGATIVIFFTFTLFQVLPYNTTTSNLYTLLNKFVANSNYSDSIDLNEKSSNILFVTSKI
jgi:NADH-ubiquinone oxidoreductase chain 6